MPMRRRVRLASTPSAVISSPSTTTRPESIQDEERRRDHVGRVVELGGAVDLGSPRRLYGPEHGDERRVLLESYEVVEEGRNDPSYRLRQDRLP